MSIAEDVPNLMEHNCEQVNACWSSAVEFGIVIRRGINKPAIAGCGGVHPDSGTVCLTKLATFKICNGESNRIQQ